MSKEVSVRLYTDKGRLYHNKKWELKSQTQLKYHIKRLFNGGEGFREDHTDYLILSGLLNPDEKCVKVLPTNISLRCMKTGRFISWKKELGL